MGEVVTDHLLDDEVQKFLGELWIEFRFRGEFAQSRDLIGFARGICGWQPGDGLQLADLLRELETFREKVDERRIDVVYGVAQALKFL